MDAHKPFIVQCSSCKKIRQNGKWEEKPIGPDAEISHGICPKCASVLYPEYAVDAILYN